jgi:ubiquinone/menaquinone biosynthesis C-methylase UbiE
MPDIWSEVAALDTPTQQQLADILETRGADLQQRAMREAFLGDLPLTDGARVIEVGCGTGVLTRVLAQWPGVGSVQAVDPAPALLERARALASALGNVSFIEGDARALPFDDACCDVVVFDSALSHIPEPASALAEAVRVLVPGGVLAAFDGDYATATVALGDHDPLQACVDEMMARSVNDRWLVRRLPALLREQGLELLRLRGHSYVDTAEDGYMRTVVERGIALLGASGELGEGAAEALRAEVSRRAREARFYGHIAYGSIVARKPL